MCEFCTKHGEGKTWYLNAKNYSTELLNDFNRKHFIEHFYEEVIHKGSKKISLLEKSLVRKMGIPSLIKKDLIKRMKESHFGQVVPIEEVEKILSLSHSICRLTCGCKWAKEKKESRLCYGLTIGTPAWHDFLDLEYFGSPDLSRLETFSRQDALHHIRKADEQGFVHSIWTFHTPFIGGICNCEKSYCLSMRATVGLNIPIMFRAEYVAVVDADACQGCRSCLPKCQFGAIEYHESPDTCRIDIQKCYGCGVCRPACPADAISLRQRQADPAAASLR